MSTGFQGAEEYRRILLEDNSKIRCEALVVTFSSMFHDFQPIILHLLRKCLGIRKLAVRLSSDLVVSTSNLLILVFFLYIKNLCFMQALY